MMSAKIKSLSDLTQEERDALSPLEGSLTREQRIEVARDVLARFTKKRSKFIIDMGLYISSNRRDIATHDMDAQLKSYMLSGCQVCARGAMFLSSVDKFDRCSVYDFRWSSNGSPVERTSADWGSAQSFDIESAFEGFNNAKTWNFYESHQFGEPRLRLAAICRNIIKNHGEFKP